MVRGFARDSGERSVTEALIAPCVAWLRRWQQKREHLHVFCYRGKIQLVLIKGPAGAVVPDRLDAPAEQVS